MGGPGNYINHRFMIESGRVQEEFKRDHYLLLGVVDSVSGKKNRMTLNEREYLITMGDLVDVIADSFTVNTDSTLTGDGTAMNPLSVNFTDLTQDYGIVFNSPLVYDAGAGTVDIDNSAIYNIYNSDGSTGPTIRDVEVPSRIDFRSSDFSLIVSHGDNAAGFGVDGSITNLATAGIDGYQGIYDNAGNAVIVNQVYGGLEGDTASIVLSKNASSNFTYGEIVWSNGIDLHGYIANDSGEQLYSQAFGLVTTVPSIANDAPTYFDNNGVLRASTWADFAAALPIVNTDTNGIFDIANDGGIIPSTFVASVTDTFRLQDNTFHSDGRFEVGGNSAQIANELVRINGIQYIANGGLFVNATDDFAGSQFENVISASNNTYGLGIYASNTSFATTVQMTGSTSYGMDIASQGVPTGINGETIGLRSGIVSNATTNLRHYGLQGYAYNSELVNVGVRGSTSSDSRSGSQLNTGVEGVNRPRLDYTGYGGYFWSAQSNLSSIYSNIDMVGLTGFSNGTQNVASSNVRSIGAVFRAINASLDNNENIALLVPSTNNSGNVVLGADNTSINQSMLEVTGDVDFFSGDFTVGDGRVGINGTATPGSESILLRRYTVGEDVLRVLGGVTGTLPFLEIADDGYTAVNGVARIANEILGVGGNMNVQGVASFGSAGVFGASLSTPDGWRLLLGGSTSFNDDIPNSSSRINSRGNKLVLRDSSNTVDYGQFFIDGGNLNSIFEILTRATTAFDTTNDAVYRFTSSYWDGANNQTISSNLTASSPGGVTTITGDINGNNSIAFDEDSTAGNTRFLLYDVDSGTLKRVSIGAADSAGAGFKQLRIAN